MRQVAFGIGIVLAGLATARAEDLKGTVTSVDAKNNRIVIQVDGKPRTLDVIKDATIVEQGEGSKKKAAPITPVTNGLAGVKTGSTVELRTEDQDGKTVVTSLKQAPTSDNQANANPKTKPAVKPGVKPNKANGVRKKSLRKKLAQANGVKKKGAKKPAAVRRVKSVI